MKYFLRRSLHTRLTRTDTKLYLYLSPGGASVLGNTPIDVIKTRMQSGGHQSSLECVRQLAGSEGLRGFYKGCLPRLNRVCLEVALAFTIFDTVQNCFRKIWPS